VDSPGRGAYDAVVLAVPHREFLADGAEGVRAYAHDAGVLYDVKGALPRDAVHGRL
jgi:UDP-N-acetyl-D-galactosamine dehydrogenase